MYPNDNSTLIEYEVRRKKDERNLQNDKERTNMTLFHCRQTSIHRLEQDLAQKVQLEQKPKIPNKFRTWETK